MRTEAAGRESAGTVWLGPLPFFLLAYGWSWLFWVPAALISRGLPASPAIEGFFLGPFNPAAWGPFVAAFLLTFLGEGTGGVKKLLKRGVDYKIGVWWYLVIFLLFPALIGGALLLAVLSGDPVPEMPAFANPFVIPVAFIYILFLGGPLQEEFGWRGYALDRLQARWNALISSVILGLAWGLWHLPLFFMPRQEFYYQRPIWGLVLSTVLVAILFTWVYNNTNRSILAAMLFHTTFNLSHFVFPALGSDLASLYLLVLMFGAVGIVLTLWGPARLSRQGSSSQKDTP